MPHAQVIVHRSAEHDAAVIEDELRQKGEHTACPRLAAHRIVAVPRGKGGGLVALFALLEHWADMAAVSAADAGIRHRGIEEALAVGQHMDGALRAAVGTGAAACAALFRRKMGRGIFRHKRRPPTADFYLL